MMDNTSTPLSNLRRENRRFRMYDALIKTLHFNARRIRIHYIILIMNQNELKYVSLS